MKILFWADGFYPTIGGRETQIFQFVLELSQRGHDCLVLAQSAVGGEKEERVNPQLLIRRFDFNRLLAGDKTIIDLIRTYLLQLREAMAPEIVHLDSGTGGSLLGFSLLHRLFQVPKILTLHGPCLHHRWLPAMTEQLFPVFDAIVGVSQWVMRDLAAHFPAIQPQLKLVYNGLNPPDLQPTNLPFNPPIILLCGRLSLEKGFHIALQAFSLLKQKGSLAHLWIVGEGLHRPVLEEWIQNLGLYSCLRMLGAISRDGLQEIYCQATVVVVPSFTESFSLVTLEAMLLQRPVIASSVGGIPELIVEGVTGRLIPPKNPEALALALEDLLKSPDLCRQMGQAGRQRALQYFTLNQHVEGYESIYAQCCASNL